MEDLKMMTKKEFKNSYQKDTFLIYMETRKME